MRAEGIDAMTADDGEYVGEPIALDEAYPELTHRRFRTSCDGGRCRMLMSRELPSGGFKRLTLRPVPGRPGVFAGRSSGESTCGLPPAGGAASGSGSAGRCA